MSRKVMVAVVIVMVLIAGLMLVSAGSAFADAGTHASCIGHEASGVSPVGSSDELPGGMPQLKQFFDETFPGVPTGTFYSTIAKVHAGSHEACDEAFE